MRVVAVYWLAFGIVFVASMAVHDIFVFADVRACINASIQNLSPSESRPSAAVRSAFRFDDGYLYGNTAFKLYRDEFFRRGWHKHAHFDSQKIPATLTWAMALWLSFDRPRVEAYRLRWLGAEELSVGMYGKGLNALDEEQLTAVVRATGKAADRPVCPW